MFGAYKRRLGLISEVWKRSLELRSKVWSLEVKLGSEGQKLGSEAWKRSLEGSLDTWKLGSLVLKFRKVFVPQLQPSGRGIILVRQHNWNCYRKFMYFSPALRTHSQNTSLFCYN